MCEEILRKAKEWFEQGGNYILRNQYHKAVELYDRAIRGFNEAEKLGYDEKECCYWRARAQYELSRCYGNQGHYLEAGVEYKKAIEGFNRAEELGYDGKECCYWRACALYGLGWCWYDLGQYHKAVDAFKRAIEGFDEAEELGYDGKECCYLRAQALRGLGWCWYDLGQYHKAVELYDQAITGFNEAEKLGYDGKECCYWRAQALYGLGWCYYDQNHCSEAILAFERAIEELKSVRIDVSSPLCLQAYTLTILSNIDIGKIYYHQRSKEDSYKYWTYAITSLELCIKKIREINLLKIDDIEKCLSYIDAFIYFLREHKETDIAIKVNSLESELLVELKKRKYAMYTRWAYYYYKRALLESNPVYFKESKKFAERCAAYHICASVEYQRGRQREAQNDYKGALNCYNSGIKYAERFRGGLADIQMREQMLEPFWRLYERACVCALRIEKPILALRYREQMACRTLLDYMGGQGYQLLKRLPEEERKEIEGIFRDWRECQRRLDQEEIDKETVEQLNKFEQEWYKIIEGLKNRYPDITFSASMHILPKIEDIQQGLASNEVILEYFLEKLIGRMYRVHIWVIRRDGIEYCRGGDISLEELSSALGILTDTSGGAYNDWREEGKRLYDCLIAPIESRLVIEKDEQRGKNIIKRVWDILKGIFSRPSRAVLYIVPYRQLHRIPFSALPVSRRGFLGDRYYISQLPSALCLKTDIFEGGVGSPGFYLGFAIEKYGGFRIKIKKQKGEFTDKPLGDLIGACEVIGELFSYFDETKPLTEEEVTRQNIFEQIRAMQGKAGVVLNFFVHGLVDETALKSVFFIKSEDCEGRIGRLHASELLSLPRLEGDFCLLGACQAGRQMFGEWGDDLVGFVRSFFTLGFRVVIAPVAEIPKESVFTFAQEFYRLRFDRGLSIPEAYIQAQKRCRKEWEKPLYWAPYILFGKPTA